MKARRRQAFKGRGAVSNPAGRFESVDHEVFDDGWGSAEEEPEAPATELRADPARTVITRNRSPDIPFEASINPYRGCEHACPYCLDGDTPILMADGRHVPIKRLQPGDRIIGTRRQGVYRRYVETTVKAYWRTHKPAYRIRLADGTEIVASGDHRFLTERGWKYVTGTMAGHGRRPYLTPNNKLMGTGQFRPALDRALKSDAALRVVAIEPLGATRTMYDITTGTGDFIANGVVSHNCFARPSHSYLDLSPGLDFETRIFYKDNAAERLEAELRKPGYRPTPISLGINTDAYQPAERRLRVTRSLLEVLWDYRHPVSLITKSALITRDLDILGPMAEHGLVSAAVSVTSMDPDTKRRLEPRTAGPAARLRTIRALADAGVPTGVMAAPVIPAITDHELEAILAAAAEAGARGAGYVLLRLPHELKQVFRDWLETHYPDRAEHVMSLVRQSRGGKDYDAAWGTRMTGTGVFADMIAQRFRAASRRHGLDHGDRAPLTTALFRVPPRNGDQMTLL